MIEVRFINVPSTGFTTMPVTPKKRPWNEIHENQVTLKNRKLVLWVLFFLTLCTINSRYLIGKFQKIDKVTSPLTNSFLPLAVLVQCLQVLCACAIVSAEENQSNYRHVLRADRHTNFEKRLTRYVCVSWKMSLFTILCWTWLVLWRKLWRKV